MKILGVICVSMASVAVTAVDIMDMLSQRRISELPPDFVGPKYKKLQPLGFGIYTGPEGGRADISTVAAGCNPPISPECVDYQPSEEACPDPKCPGIPWSYNNTCMVCYNQAFNNCGCGLDEDGAYVCEYAAGKSGTSPLDSLECYLGKSNLTEDITGRLKIMEMAVDRAYEVSDDNEAVLKVFNAPEFYWRGPDGAYALSSILESTPDAFNPLNEIGIGLTKLVQQARFKDWLFIFGTVIAVHELDETESNQTQYEYLNFAPIYKGFDPDETNPRGMRFLAPKRYVSGIDFLIPAERVGSSAVDNPDGALYNNALFLQLADWLLKEHDYAMIYNSFFVMNGITMSVEICLDHAEQFAMKSFVTLMNADDFTIPTGGNGRLEHTPLLSGADFSIVTSAGMSINRDNLVLVDDGSIFLVDGLSLAEVTERGIHLKELLQACSIAADGDMLIGYECSDKTGELEIHEVFLTAEEATLALDGLYSIKPSYDMYINDGMPVIGVFPSIDLPTHGQPQALDSFSGDAGKGSTEEDANTGEDKSKVQEGDTSGADLGSGTVNYLIVYIGVYVCMLAWTGVSV